MSPIYVPGKVVLAKDYTAGDRYFNETSLLLHGNADGSGNILDSSPSPKTVSKFGNAASATPPSYPNSNSAFGNAIAFDGNGDYLLSTLSSILSFGRSDFTVESWIYLLALPASYATIVDSRPANGNYTDALGWAVNNLGQLGLYADDWLVGPTGTISTNQWTHVALTRQGTNLRQFINGSQAGSGASDYNFSRQDAYVGTTPSTFFFNGYIDDLRITKGVARYTSNFTLPTAPFADGYY
jgi:hypothetical protein